MVISAGNILNGSINMLKNYILVLTGNNILLAGNILNKKYIIRWWILWRYCWYAHIACWTTSEKTDFKEYNKQS